METPLIQKKMSGISGMLYDDDTLSSDIDGR